jgi:protein-S-isoprenylcysteine O-methyltransferase Ste14
MRLAAAAAVVNSPREFLKRHSCRYWVHGGRFLSETRARDTEQTAASLERIIYCVYFVIIYYTYIVHTTFNAYVCVRVGTKRVAAHTHTHTGPSSHINTCIYIIYACVSVCFDVVKRHIIHAAIVPFMER